jgi:hypothetical protein
MCLPPHLACKMKSKEFEMFRATHATETWLVNGVKVPVSVSTVCMHVPEYKRDSRQYKVRRPHKFVGFALL